MEQSAFNPANVVPGISLSRQNATRSTCLLTLMRSFQQV
ncbi:hypothetical protein OH492_11600 [Vibrio chagasii]|nr:hypothetical protein [Vibrio chagasii]